VAEAENSKIFWRGLLNGTKDLSFTELVPIMNIWKCYSYSIHLKDP
jgi:hypothetical protein